MLIRRPIEEVFEGARMTVESSGPRPHPKERPAPQPVLVEEEEEYLPEEEEGEMEEERETRRERDEEDGGRKRRRRQEVDDVPAFEPVTKWNATIDDVARFPDLIRHACRVATRPRTPPRRRRRAAGTWRVRPRARG